MSKIVAQLQYFPRDVKRFKNIDVKPEDLRRIKEKYGTSIVGRVVRAGPGGLIARRIFSELLFEMVIITVAGDQEEAVRNSIADIVKLYGKPDIPSVLWGSKRQGSRIAKSVVEEYAFSVFDFEGEIPEGWRIQLSHKSDYFKGTLKLISPSKGEVDLLWAPLDRFKDQYPNPEAYFDSDFEKLKADKNITGLRIEKEAGEQTADHLSTFHKISYLEKQVQRRVMGVGIYCRKTDRFIILYCDYSSDKTVVPEQVIEKTLRSFRCKHA